jgi:death-on-curing family protein
MEIPKISDEKPFMLENGLLLPPKELIAKIHDALIIFYRKISGVGQLGFRDEATLEYTLLHIQNRKYDPDKKLENALKVSVELFYDIISKHPFMDGNKRTAWAISLLMLERNFNLYLNKKCQADEADEGEACLDISKWVEPDADKAPLEKRIREAGVVPPTQKKINIEDVKRYISHLLLKHIRMES